MDHAEGLPEYASELAAFHAAFAAELQAMVATLPIAAGQRALDMACGDGVYARWLAERVGPSGRVVAVDIDRAFLDLAQRTAADDAAVAARIELVAAPLERLPFGDATFDLAWCAQNLFSLPDPVTAIRHLARVVKPGGVVAVLENDTLHQVLLPWPVEIELAERRAELVGFVKESGEPRKYYVSRRLRRDFEAAGLVDCRHRTFATDRQAPLDPATWAFLRSYLDDLRGRAAPHLEPPLRARAERLLDPHADDYLLDWPDLALTVVDHVVWGRKPAIP